MTNFSDEEIERYARHLVMPEIGGTGQQRLKRTRLLVIGAGGLGSPVLTACAAAGIGTIGIADDDKVALSDLQRQTIYRSDWVGRPKVDCVAETIAGINPNCIVQRHHNRIDPRNIDALAANYDLVADCTDNAASRYAVSDGCFRQKKTLVIAAVRRFDGSVTTLKPHEAGAGGEPNPTYRCLFRDPPADEAACAQIGVLGPLVTLVGAIQALEIAKEASGLGSSLVGKLLLLDGRSLRFETIGYRWDPANPLNGSAPRQMPRENLSAP